MDYGGTANNFRRGDRPVSTQTINGSLGISLRANIRSGSLFRGFAFPCGTVARKARGQGKAAKTAITTDRLTAKKSDYAKHALLGV